MSARGVPFVFYEPDDEFVGGMRATVRAGIATVDELHDVLSEELHLPSYFERTWTALAEVLADLAWLAPRRIILVHEDLPDLLPEELRAYLDVLRRAVEDWMERTGAHELAVAFPEAQQLAIRRLLA